MSHGTTRACPACFAQPRLQIPFVSSPEAMPFKEGEQCDKFAESMHPPSLHSQCVIVAAGLQDALGGRPLPKGPALIPPLPYVPLDAAFLGDYVEQVKSGNAFPLLAAHYLLSRSRVWSPPGPRRSPTLPVPLPVATLNALMGTAGPDDPYALLRPR